MGFIAGEVKQVPGGPGEGSRPRDGRKHREGGGLGEVHPSGRFWSSAAWELTRRVGRPGGGRFLGLCLEAPVARRLFSGAPSWKNRAFSLSPVFLHKDLGPHVARAGCAERPGSWWRGPSRLPGVEMGSVPTALMLMGPLVLPTWNQKESKGRCSPGAGRPQRDGVLIRVRDGGVDVFLGVLGVAVRVLGQRSQRRDTQQAQQGKHTGGSETPCAGLRPLSPVSLPRGMPAGKNAAVCRASVLRSR